MLFQLFFSCYLFGVVLVFFSNLIKNNFFKTYVVFSIVITTVCFMSITDRATDVVFWVSLFFNTISLIFLSFVYTAMYRKKTILFWIIWVFLLIIFVLVLDMILNIDLSIELN